jgi:hypothetical protein
MAITLTRDCDVVRRPDPTAYEGDFRDTYIEEISPNTMHDGTQVSAGIVVPAGKGSEYRRFGLFHYDLRAFVPDSAVITAAMWHFYVRSTDSTAEHSFRAVRTKRDWFERVATWYAFKSPSDGGYASSGGADYLEESGAGWDTDEWVGFPVSIISGTGAGQTRTVTSNTAVRLYVSPDWTTPPDNTSQYAVGNLWTTPGALDVTDDRDMGTLVNLGSLHTTGWFAKDLLTIVSDAWDNRSGVCAFLLERYDAGAGIQGVANIDAKNYYDTDPATVHHLRITYTLDGRTHQAHVR